METPLFLYNSYSRTKEAFEPLDKKNVRMYVCGPTVYDRAHIGNARPVLVFDILFRLLRYLYKEDNVTYVRNITDIDDKINAKIAKLMKIKKIEPKIKVKKNLKKIVLEGGAIDVNGRGSILLTRECLLSKVQERNPGVNKLNLENAFRKYLNLEFEVGPTTKP